MPDPMAYALLDAINGARKGRTPIRLPEPASPAPESTTPSRPTRPSVPALGMTESEFRHHLEELHP